MTNTEELEEEELRATNYPKFRVLTGGKGPPEPPVDNWLGELETGTTFVSRRINSKDCDYELFHVFFIHCAEVFFLKWMMPDGKVWDKYVRPELFSKQFERGVVLGIIKTEEQDGNSNRTDRPADMVQHAAMQGEHQRPEDTGNEEPNLPTSD